MRRLFVYSVLVAAGSMCLPLSVQAFCGFYVAKGGTSLFNQSSQVVYVRDGDRSIVTMGSDFKGDVKEFAMVVPVPVVVQKEQVKLVNNSTIKQLDDFSAPRLVEYYDSDPCRTMEMEMAARPVVRPRPMMRPAMARNKELGVKIEASYTLGEYDIMVLSAKDSGGLVTWLNENKYKIPAGAEPVINSYLKQNMKFFIAKVNLKEYSKTGFTQLRPIQVNYREKRFMLPIRLGTVNARGKQDLFVYGITRKGRIETTNYRTTKVPTDLNIPTYVKTMNQFGRFYRDLFNTQVNKNEDGVFLEYAWNMSWCDPCVGTPLNNKQLRELGAFWLTDNSPTDAYITRLHVRYDRETFPEDLAFQVTGNTDNFQARYIINHPFAVKPNACPAAKTYVTQTLPRRWEEEAKNAASLTGWDVNVIRKKIADTKPKI
ncbi:DUF2330 domain-containing protein [Thiofilum flexile]|uniref:DUF2330 domain-containing protein n=1 Tax=Thiofilum flexile TaxID=125627 RepID=UPI0003A224BB|nr:DUF2330 domain-containing protein [Thiofilum flexile]